MITIKRTITEDYVCNDCRYQSIDEEFSVEFAVEPNQPPFGMIHCPACGGGDREVTLDIAKLFPNN